MVHAVSDADSHFGVQLADSRPVPLCPLRPRDRDGERPARGAADDALSGPGVARARGRPAARPPHPYRDLDGLPLLGVQCHLQRHGVHGATAAKITVTASSSSAASPTPRSAPARRARPLASPPPAGATTLSPEPRAPRAASSCRDDSDHYSRRCTVAVLSCRAVRVFLQSFCVVIIISGEDSLRLAARHGTALAKSLVGSPRHASRFTIGRAQA